MRTLVAVLLLALAGGAEEFDPLVAPIEMPAPRRAVMKARDELMTGTLDAANTKRVVEFDVARGAEVRVHLQALKGNLSALRLHRRRVRRPGKWEWNEAGGGAWVEKPLGPFSSVWSGRADFNKHRIEVVKWNAAKTKYKIRWRVIPRPDGGSGADAGAKLPEAVRIAPGKVTGFLGLADQVDTFVLPNVAAGRRVQVRLVAIGDAHGRGTDFLLPNFWLSKGHVDPRGRPVWQEVANHAHTSKRTTLPVVLTHTSDHPEHYLIQLGYANSHYLKYELQVTVGPGRDPKAELRYVRYANGRYAPLPEKKKLRYGDHVFVEARFDIVPARVTENVKLDIGGRTRMVPVKRTKKDPKVYRSPAILIEER